MLQSGLIENKAHINEKQFNGGYPIVITQATQYWKTQIVRHFMAPLCRQMILYIMFWIIFAVMMKLLKID